MEFESIMLNEVLEKDYDLFFLYEMYRLMYNFFNNLLINFNIWEDYCEF